MAKTTGLKAHCERCLRTERWNGNPVLMVVDAAFDGQNFNSDARQSKSGSEMPTKGDIELVRTIDLLSSISGYKSIEICWMTWLIQSEGEVIRMEKYRDVLDKI